MTGTSSLCEFVPSSDRAKADAFDEILADARCLYDHIPGEPCPIHGEWERK